MAELTCSTCRLSKPQSAYTASQIKKRGNRRCRACITLPSEAPDDLTASLTSSSLTASTTLIQAREEFLENTLVIAKNSQGIPWPGQISKPTGKNRKFCDKGKYFVRFFGGNQSLWVPQIDVRFARKDEAQTEAAKVNNPEQLHQAWLALLQTMEGSIPVSILTTPVAIRERSLVINLPAEAEVYGNEVREKVASGLSLATGKQLNNREQRWQEAEQRWRTANIALQESHERIALLIQNHEKNVKRFHESLKLSEEKFKSSQESIKKSKESRKKVDREHEEAQRRIEALLKVFPCDSSGKIEI